MALPHFTNIHLGRGMVNSKYEPYQFVYLEDELYILRFSTFDSSRGTYCWNVWLVTPDGYIENPNYYIVEDDILGIVETFVYININYIHNHSFEDCAEFITHYKQLKVNHFLNNL